MQGAHTIRPFFTQCKAICTSNIITGAAHIRGSDLEACREYDAVHRIFLPVGDNAVFGNPFHTVSIGVDQLNAGAVERLQVAVMETGTLTELTVVGLEGFGCFRVLYQLRSAVSYLFHFLEIGDFHELGHLIPVGAFTSIVRHRN